MIRRVRVKGPGVKLANKWCYIGDEATVDEQEFEKNKEYVDVIEEIEEPKTEPENPINPEGEQNDGTVIYVGTNDEGENSGENKNETSEDEELEALKARAKELNIKVTANMKKETIINKIEEAEKEAGEGQNPEGE
jgi:hypothetical protein|nr:MAG TPA: HeH/LEM domain [Caudoviricetes sp.]